MKKVVIHTDGSADNMKGLGGFAYIAAFTVGKETKTKEYFSPRYEGTTNNRMELKAVIKALEDMKPGHFYEVISDSKYCIDSLNKGWLRNWVKSGKLKQRKNSELWMRFIRIFDTHIEGGSTFLFSWVKGHNGNTMNEKTDRLANSWRKSDNNIQCLENN